MKHRLPYAYVLVGAIVCAWSAGCSKGGLDEGPVVIISGKLSNGGQPLATTPDSVIEVVLTPFTDKGEEVDLKRVYRVHPDEKGEFKLTGNLGHGVSPGKYRHRRLPVGEGRCRAKSPKTLSRGSVTP